ncbi:MAG: hypothetical protein Q8O04_07215 [Deltaproteobacteria bacterium]|nr:hypothetical protein [Deltaproteobacteria bacterium]
MSYDLLNELLQIFSEPYSGVVYHYTSADGVAGIIGNHEIWMSNTAFMNDTTELKMLQSARSIFKEDDFTNEYVRSAWRNVLQQGSYDTNYYMASFSKEKDLLEQWRAYGSFCIGFDARKLRVRKGASLYRCLYRASDIRRWILRKEKTGGWAQLTEEIEKKLLAFNLFYIASMKFKNGHFKNEKEVRLITMSHHNWHYDNSPEMYEDNLPIHFRTHPVYGFPVPYVKFFIEQDDAEKTKKAKGREMEMKARKLREESAKERKLLPITEVIVGPVAYQKEAKAACEILLAERGYKNVRVNVSSIPYRGL